MTSIAARILDALDPTAASKAAAITGQQSPTPDQLAEDSAERADMFGPAGDADGPDIEPEWQGERPLLADTLDALVRTLRSTLLGSPPPNRVTVYRVNPAAEVAGIAVQLVPPAEGRRRRILLQCVTGTCYVADDRRDTGVPTTGDLSGFVLDDGVTLPQSQVIELTTSGALYSTGDDAYDVRVLIEHYPDAAG